MDRDKTVSFIIAKLLGGIKLFYKSPSFRTDFFRVDNCFFLGSKLMEHMEPFERLGCQRKGKYVRAKKQRGITARQTAVNTNSILSSVEFTVHLYGEIRLQQNIMNSTDYCCGDTFQAAQCALAAHPRLPRSVVQNSMKNSFSCSKKSAGYAIFAAVFA